MKHKLLIITKEQFGYLTDVYYWCKYLRDQYQITVMCFDSGKKKILLDGVAVRYISYKGCRKIRGVRFILESLMKLLLFKGKVIIEYFEHCDILKKIYPHKKMIVDIRTLSISSNPVERAHKDNALYRSCRLFDKITVISQGVRNRIDLENISILPLGAEPISTEKKNYSRINLLYVGTFSGRNIDKTIEGIKIFHTKFPEADFSYDIIGYGFDNEEVQLMQLVENLELTKYVRFHGKIPNTELKPFFDRNNIGVSFVPITDYYNYQPPTKTFEYAMSGLFVIATSTEANKELITEKNGLLINDSAEDFAVAMEKFYSGLKIEELHIRQSLSHYSWKNIVNGTLKQILISF